MRPILFHLRFSPVIPRKLPHLVFWSLWIPAEPKFHRLTNYIDTKAKCNRLKKFTCKDFAAGVNKS